MVSRRRGARARARRCPRAVARARDGAGGSGREARGDAREEDEMSKTERSSVARGGEGIGPEVVDATCEVLAASGMPVTILTPPHGAAAVASHGAAIPDETRRACESAD